jgi:hypothetical protein
MVINNLGDNIVTLEQIKKLQLQTKIEFPKDYIEFIIQHNGGIPEPNFFEIPNQDGNGSYVDLFFGIDVPSYANLKDILEVYKNRLPEGFVPIGEDPGGNLICIGTRIPYIGNIYFWDHHDELDESGLSKKDMSNMYWLADNLFDFIDNLHEPEDRL